MRRRNSSRSALCAAGEGSTVASPAHDAGEDRAIVRAAHARSRVPRRSASQKIKQEYDTDVESTFVDASEFADKKSIYVTIVGGLIVVAFVAPMLQFFYYTGGD